MTTLALYDEAIEATSLFFKPVISLTILKPDSSAYFIDLREYESSEKSTLLYKLSFFIISKISFNLWNSISSPGYIEPGLEDTAPISIILAPSSIILKILSIALELSNLDEL